MFIFGCCKNKQPNKKGDEYQTMNFCDMSLIHLRSRNVD